MDKTELVDMKIAEAEKRVKELLDSGDLKKLVETEKYSISSFYEKKSLNRLESARLIFQASRDRKDYTDFSEVVAAAYYAMYYVVHAFVALIYQRKLREGLRGVHAITLHLILYYLVKTKQLERHLYEEYCQTFETATELVKLEDLKLRAYDYVEKYREEQGKRERFTYFVSSNAEERQAGQSLETAEKFISTVRQMMMK